MGRHRTHKKGLEIGYECLLAIDELEHSVHASLDRVAQVGLRHLAVEGPLERHRACA